MRNFSFEGVPKQQTVVQIQTQIKSYLAEIFLIIMLFYF